MGAIEGLWWKWWWVFELLKVEGICWRAYQGLWFMAPIRYVFLLTFRGNRAPWKKSPTTVHYSTLQYTTRSTIVYKRSSLSKVLYDMTLCRMELRKNRISLDFPEDGSSNSFETSANPRILQFVPTPLWKLQLKYLTSWATISISERTLFHWVT